MKHLAISPAYIDALLDKVGRTFDKQLVEEHSNAVTLDLRISELRSQIRQTIDKIKYLSSETAIKYMEEDIVRLEQEITELETQRQQEKEQKPVDMAKMTIYVRFYLEHLEKLLLNFGNPVLQARYFGLIFNEAPTYKDLDSGTPDISKITGVNEVFKAALPGKNTYGWG